MLVHEEIALIAAVLFKRGGLYQTGQQRIYLFQGEEVDGSSANYVVHTIDEARTFAKLYINGQRKDKFRTLRWGKWCEARQNIFDQAHGEGAYQKFMERLTR